LSDTKVVAYRLKIAVDILNDLMPLLPKNSKPSRTPVHIDLIIRLKVRIGTAPAVCVVPYHRNPHQLNFMPISPGVKNESGYQCNSKQKNFKANRD